MTLVPDPRSVKVASGNSMIDYLQTILWMHMGSKTQLRQFSVDSDKCLQIQFTDVLTHVVWSYYEFGQASPFDSLSSSIVVKELFFKPV